MITVFVLIAVLLVLILVSVVAAVFVVGMWMLLETIAFKIRRAQKNHDDCSCADQTDVKH